MGEGGVICCSKNTFFASVFLWMLVSLGGLGFTLYAMLAGTGVYLVPPDTFYIGMVGLFGLWTIVTISGVLTRAFHSEIALTFFIVMTFLTILITIFGFVFVLLYANDVSTFSGLDQSVGDAQNQAELAFFQWASDPLNRNDWIESQNQLDCCGYDFETELTPQFQNKLTTGDRCGEAQLALTQISTACVNNTYSKACETTWKQANQLEGEGFFCKDAITLFFQDQTALIAGGGAFLMLLQLISWIAALRLYWVPFQSGGFYIDGSGYDDGLPTKAPAANSDMPSSLPAPNGGMGGMGGGPPQMSGFGNAVRRVGNRMSARMPSMRANNNQVGFGSGPPGGFGNGAPGGFGNGAPGGFGNGAPGGFGASGGGGAPGGPPPGPPGGFGGAMRNFGNRVSMKVMNKPLFGGARPPPGPPPSLGGGGGPGGASSYSSDMPAPNAGMGGGGFGAKMKGFGNRVSMKMAGKPLFGGGAPPRPPPGFGGGAPGGFGQGPPSSGGGSGFGGGAPPAPSGGGFGRGPPGGGGGFGGGAPPRGPPGGGFGGPPRGGFGGGAPPRPQMNQAPPKAAAPKRGMFGGGGGKAPAARPPNPMGGGGRGGLLAQIQQGKRLNHAHTNDRSGPMV